MTSAVETLARYDQDFVRWSEEQARALREATRSGTNLPLDWENLAEEVESLGTSQRSVLRSRIAKVIEHLLKLRCSPAINPRRGWVETVLRERLEIQSLLGSSPSLRREVAGIVAEQMRAVARLTAQVLALYGEATPEVRSSLGTADFNEEQVLGDWLPDFAGGA